MTAFTAPWDSAINIDSVTCGCCDTRWWPETAPRFPENYVCDVCTTWIRLFNHDNGIPVYGPIKTIRELLTGNNIPAQQLATDQSPWVVINTHPDIHNRMGALINQTQALNDTDPDDHIPAQKIRG